MTSFTTLPVCLGGTDSHHHSFYFHKAVSSADISVETVLVSAVTVTFSCTDVHKDQTLVWKQTTSSV